MKKIYTLIFVSINLYLNAQDCKGDTIAPELELISENLTVVFDIHKPFMDIGDLVKSVKDNCDPNPIITTSDYYQQRTIPLNYKTIGITNNYTISAYDKNWNRFSKKIKVRVLSPDCQADNILPELNCKKYKVIPIQTETKIVANDLLEDINYENCQIEKYSFDKEGINLVITRDASWIGKEENLEIYGIDNGNNYSSCKTHIYYKDFNDECFTTKDPVKIKCKNAVKFEYKDNSSIIVYPEDLIENAESYCSTLVYFFQSGNNLANNYYFSRFDWWAGRYDYSIKAIDALGHSTSCQDSFFLFRDMTNCMPDALKPSLKCHSTINFDILAHADTLQVNDIIIDAKDNCDRNLDNRFLDNNETWVNIKSFKNAEKKTFILISKDDTGNEEKCSCEVRFTKYSPCEIDTIKPKIKCAKSPIINHTDYGYAVYPIDFLEYAIDECSEVDLSFDLDHTIHYVEDMQLKGTTVEIFGKDITGNEEVVRCDYTHHNIPMPYSINMHYNLVGNFYGDELTKLQIFAKSEKNLINSSFSKWNNSGIGDFNLYVTNEINQLYLLLHPSQDSITMNQITSVDNLRIKKFILGDPALITDLNGHLADINCDGEINILDMQGLFTFVNNNLTTTPDLCIGHRFVSFINDDGVVLGDSLFIGKPESQNIKIYHGEIGDLYTINYKAKFNNPVQTIPEKIYFKVKEQLLKKGENYIITATLNDPAKISAMQGDFYFDNSVIINGLSSNIGVNLSNIVLSENKIKYVWTDFQNPISSNGNIEFYFYITPTSDLKISEHMKIFNEEISNMVILDSSQVKGLGLSIENSNNTSLVPGVSYIQVYPNPAKENLVVETNKQCAISSLQLINNVGKNIWIKDDLNTMEYVIPLKGIEAGIYMLIISFDNGDKFIRKVVIDP